MVARRQPGRSVLFLSADLVGSTDYKQKHTGWQRVFLSFYHEFPEKIEQAKEELLSAELKNEDERYIPEFKLWKAVGDELIFEVHINHERTAVNAVRIWLSALSIYEQNVLSDNDTKTLALKGSGFIATFPGPDSESTIPRRIDKETKESDEDVVTINDERLRGKRAYTKYHYDYFGPSIDTGFRIASKASHRYFTISVEVALCLALTAYDATASQKPIWLHELKDLVYHGEIVFKGVWSGRPYPLFAIDRQANTPLVKAFQPFNGKTLDPQAVFEACYACLGEKEWPSGIFLPDSQHERVKENPPDVMESLRQSAPLAGETDETKRLSTTEVPLNFPLGDKTSTPKK
ncbi:hypothetical protein [Leucobacter sp. OH1287]|uniref:hypothetical protein n=1 Tax=Leucobacter sp. OH1287 TaxID=2491049 RepID=UPI000F5ED335|nr:hypothetical protein [Leucobacter sp. OH1287]RRD61349.1 hypothetical protein EII30_02830 [Leucobacter sp. OH1287]